MQKYEKIIDNSYECPIFFRHLVPDTPLRGFACSGPFPGLFSGFAGGGIRSMQLKKIKNAASKIAIIQYRILPEDFFAQRKGFAAWQ